MIIFIIILLISSPICFYIYKKSTKKDPYINLCQEKIDKAKHKITITIDETVQVFTYLESKNYGKSFTRERMFLNGSYQHSKTKYGNVNEVMQERIDKIEDKTPNAEISVTFPEEENATV